MKVLLRVSHEEIYKNYNNIFFSAVEVNECTRKWQPSYISLSYFIVFPQTLYFNYSKVHVVHRFSPTFCAKLIAEYFAEEFLSAVLPYVALKEVAHGMICLSESPVKFS